MASSLMHNDGQYRQASLDLMASPKVQPRREQCLRAANRHGHGISSTR